MNLPGPNASVDLGVDKWIKARSEDFVVEEVPAYPLTGKGTHLWLRVQKRGLGTRAVIGRLERLFGRPARQFGIAGQKDARAVTIQWISIEHPPADFEERLAPVLAEQPATEPHFRILEWTWHRTRLGLGQSHGNRFEVVLRGLTAAQRARAQAGLTELAERGAPNHFGPQRFGHRGDNAEVGAALLARDVDTALGLILGRTHERDTGVVRAARLAYDAGDLPAALEQWPRDHFLERRLLGALVAGEPPEQALTSAPIRDLTFYLHAWQSAGFNRVLDRRLADGLELHAGELALRLPGGRKSFEVQDLAAERARFATLEIAPTGPLFGPQMPWPADPIAALEREVLAELGGFEHGPPLLQRAMPGGRRAIMMEVQSASSEVAATEDAPLTLRFHLAKGSFATSLLAALRLDADAC